MWRKFSLQAMAMTAFIFTASMGFARDYIIYSIAQDIPMGVENEVVKKNYYMNIGSNQGVQEGSILDVFRLISRLDPYESKKRYNYRVKIGEIEVLHSEDNAAIGHLKGIRSDQRAPFFEVGQFMIGDHVNVKIDD